MKEEVFIEALSTDTPDDIIDYNIDDVIKLVDRSKEDENCTVSLKGRLNLLKIIYKVLGYDLTPDIALIAIAEPKAMLVDATAGSGKSTLAEVKAFMQKVIRSSKINPEEKMKGDRILCLVYNDQNVKDMKNRQAVLAHRVMSRTSGSMKLDDKLGHTSTMHSFCNYWIEQNIVKAGLFGRTLLKGKGVNEFMRSVVSLGFSKSGVTPDSRHLTDEYANNLCTLYNLKRECMWSMEDCKNADVYLDLDTDLDIIENIFDKYESKKDIRKVYDYSDMLFYFHKLVTSYPDVLSNICTYYEYIIADEVQDFTPIMWSILKLLTSGGAPLFAIGDVDQNIYSFRGASIESILQFKNNFDKSSIYSLVYNRRCKENILNLAKSAISNNVLRFDKQINGMPREDKGNVELVPYNTSDGQLLNLVERLKKMDPYKYEETCICYRNKESSVKLCELLQENGIPYCVLSGSPAYSHELYYHVIGVLNALQSPYDREEYLVLYKVLPLSKVEYFKIIGYDDKKRAFKKNLPMKHFGELDYSEVIERKGLGDCLKALIAISNMIDKEPLSKYIMVLLKYLDKYYWKMIKHYNGTPDIDTEIENKVLSIFGVDQTFQTVYADIVNKRDAIRRNSEGGAGIRVSTFHKLKGLEFDDVYALDLDNSIFPNFFSIESRPYGDYNKLALKEAETRLWYVAVTRAKNNFIAYYPVNNPSEFIQNELGVVSSTVDVSLNNLDSFTLDGDIIKQNKEYIEERTFKDTLSILSDATLELSNTSSEADIFNNATSDLESMQEIIEDFDEDIVCELLDDEITFGEATSIEEDLTTDPVLDEEIEELTPNNTENEDANEVNLEKPKEEPENYNSFLSSIINRLI